jgi:cephalosporin-C deacetylase-like acetyl esterase
MKRIQTPSFDLAVYTNGNKDATKLALVLPGRLDTKDYPHMRAMVDFLASRGYLALSFDPPGTWGSAGGIETYTMTSYLLAINELIAQFGNKPTLVFGHSRGGTMAMLAGTQSEHVTHIVTVFSKTGPSRFNTPQKPGDSVVEYRDTPPNDTEHQVKFTLPYSFFEDASHHDAGEAIKTCPKPKLFFAGTRDTILPPEVVRTVYNQAAEPKQLHELDSDHDYRHHPEIVEEVSQTVRHFLDTYPS